MQIRDRIKSFRRVPAGTLLPNPKNWRTHSRTQKNVLKGVLAEIGYADALLVRELPDGTLQLLDGHLRAETTPHQDVPVLVLDLDDAEADKLLATLDPLAALAGTNQELLDDLIAQIETENSALQEFLNEMNAKDDFDSSGSEKPEIRIPELYQLVISCENEEEQKELFERLTNEGIVCRIVNL